MRGRAFVQYDFYVRTKRGSSTELSCSRMTVLHLHGIITGLVVVVDSRAPLAAAKQDSNTILLWSHTAQAYSY